jgi:hypothetical protein
VFFLSEGIAGYVLPRYNNAVYIEVVKGDHFGLIDLVYDVEDYYNEKKKFTGRDDPNRRHTMNKELKRRFTV